MANKDFIVKNGISVNNALTANSTVLNYNSKLVVNSTAFNYNYVLTSNSDNLTVNQPLVVNNTLTVANTVTFNKGLKDGNNSVGAAGQVLLSNGSGIYWSDTSGLIVANNTVTDTYYFPMTNTSTSGLWTAATIVPSKLSFNADTGTLSATNFNSLSDQNLKIDVTPITDALQKVLSVEGVSFKWKQNNIPSFGVIAQEVEKVLPELVSTKEDGIKSVNYDGFIAILIESIKILEKRIEELESKP